MADAAPVPQLPPRAPTRPRRTTKPRTSYRRSPGAVSRPVPRPAPVPASRAARLLGLARFIPGRVFFDLFFGGVSRNAERAAASEQSDLDRYRLTAAERAAARAARGAERLVRITRAAAGASNPLTLAAQASVPRAVIRSVPQLMTEPSLVLDPVSNVVRLTEPAGLAEILGSQAGPQGGAPPLTPTLPSPKFPAFPGNFPFSFPFLSPLESPLLTPFKPPQVVSSPLASPLALAEPLPQPEPQRCRCRARKPKAGKPGKGFFTIDSRGREKRRYWLNREQREKRNAGNAG